MRGGCLVITTLLLFSTLVSAEGARIEGRLRFTRALHEGVMDVQFPLDAAYANGTSTHPLRLTGTGHASRIVVNWTFGDQVGAGSAAGNPNGSLASSSVGKGETGEIAYADVGWQIRETQANGNLLLASNGSGADARLSFRGNGTLTASSNVTWQGGAPTNAGTGGGREWQRITAKRSVPLGAPVLETKHAINWNVDGSFTLYLWGVNVTVGDDTYRSGQWTTTAVGDAFGPRGIARVERAQLLRVRVEGTLAASSEAARIGWTGDTMDVRTLGRIAMEGSRGDLHIDGLMKHLQDERVAVEGSLISAVRTAREASSLETDVRSTDLLAVPPAVATQVPPDGVIQPKASDTRVTDAFGILGVAGFAGVAFFFTARRRSDTRAVAAAERALLAGCPRKAIHLLRGRLRRHEDDVDAWFLHGAAVLQEDGPHALVQSLEPVARRLTAPRRYGLSFLLAISFARLKDRRAALEWLRDASRDPLYRTRARQDPTFSDLVGEAGFLIDETLAYA